MRASASITILALVAALTSCDRAKEHDGHDEHDEHGAPAHGHEHEHEARHDEVPRSVELSPEVIEQAGIRTAVVERQALAPTVRLSGEIAPNPNREASVAARVNGVIEMIQVRPGDAVKRDDVLATVRAPDLQSLRAAEAAMRAKAASARANAERLDALVARGMASKQEALAASAEADSLEAETRAARERLRALGVSRSNRRAVTFDVRAPLDGVIVERGVMTGAPVTAETVIATIVSTEDVWFLAHVFERDVARVEPGSAASVRLNAYPDESFAGVVEYVSHQVDPGARTLSARVPLRNPDGRLRLGLYGTAHVVAAGAPGEPALAVPTSAITRMQGKVVGFVQHDDEHFEVHELVLGVSDHQYTEIVHGLREGERVVTEGAFTIKSALLRGTFGEDHH
ncbi:MAG: efflux RND transporter periplasmic adaptor subunit [Myxococcales bacterium]|nr:efflux RND transporter periplasmic adaptor subunit [Myxococcales bacterium]MCB9754993.1 efflux RND transporter periplasmic adaptor subunit [Myxococcales bacterium]